MGPSFEEGYRMARAGRRAGAGVGSSLAEAHAAIGRIKRTYDWDWAGAEASFQKALALERRTPPSAGASSLAASLGRFDEAVALNRRAVEVDPLSVVAHVSMGVHAYYATNWSWQPTPTRRRWPLVPTIPKRTICWDWFYLARSKPQQALAEV